MLSPPVLLLIRGIPASGKSTLANLLLQTDAGSTFINLDPDEVIQVQAVEFKDVIEMISTGEIQDAKTIAGIFWVSRWVVAIQ